MEMELLALMEVLPDKVKQADINKVYEQVGQQTTHMEKPFKQEDSNTNSDGHQSTNKDEDRQVWVGGEWIPNCEVFVVPLKEGLEDGPLDIDNFPEGAAIYNVNCKQCNNKDRHDTSPCTKCLNVWYMYQQVYVSNDETSNGEVNLDIENSTPIKEIDHSVSSGDNRLDAIKFR